MPKTIISILFLFVLTSQIGFTNEIPIKVIPEKRISTSDINLKQGDKIELIVSNDVYVNSKIYIKKGERVTGLITSLEDNGFLLKEASLFAEEFKVKNIHGETVDLKGIVYRKGTDYWMVMQFMPIFSVFMRGGEVHINPKKDSFLLYLEATK